MNFFKKKIPEPLRNCAFCGGEPRLTKCGDHKEFLVYQCFNCYETPVRLHEASVCEFSARRLWNQRTEEAEYIISTYNRLLASTTKFTSSEGTNVSDN